MKKLYFLFILLFCFGASAQIVNIPDANFKAKLLSANSNNYIASAATPVYNASNIWSVSTYHKIDINNDGEIQVSEAQAIKYLDIYNGSIGDLTGIEAFVNLQYLNCSSNNLTSLNVTGLTNLQALGCNFNQLSSLDVSSLINLKSLSCVYNQISNLNISGLINLHKLYCFNNQLVSLDVSQSTLLNSLQCNNNQIPSLNVSGLTNLQILWCNNNQLTNLNVLGCSSLQTLNCYTNQLPSLNVSGLTNLQTLKCNNNQLTNLNVLGCSSLQTLHCFTNQLPSLNTSGLTNLQIVWCHYNQLESLDVLGCTSLQTLRCHDNQLTNLNLFGCSSLLTLECYNNQLTNLDLDDCTNLQTLRCYTNQLTSLDFSDCTNLQSLWCYNNQLTSLDFSNCTNLQSLWCYNNQLEGLNVSQNILLFDLICGNNILTSLNVSQNTVLNTLDCQNNQLVNLDVSQNTELTNLSCENNLLTFLDVSQNILLNTFLCNNNQLSSLDVSQNTALNYLICYYNQLEFLNIKNGNQSAWSGLDFFNTNIQFVCADEEDVSFVQQLIDNYGLTSTCHVNSYCNFTPGGPFYTIEGNNHYDHNSNGCDALDVDFSNLKLNITDNTNAVGTFITNSSGSYYYDVHAGTHTIVPQLENPTYFSVSPSTTSINFPTQTSPFTQNFCVTPNGVHHDVEITLLPTNPARPGFNANYKLIYKNVGNQIENGTVNFIVYEEHLSDYVSSIPVFTNSNSTSNITTYTWNYSNLQPFETREIDIVLNINTPTETPAVNNGDELNYGTSITTLSNDENEANNGMGIKQIVVGSYDPNDKTCVEGNTITPEMVGKYVHYMIRFENTGTYPAENIVVKDMIDLTKFDISTLTPVSGNHEFYTRINGNKVEFIFENINLDFNDATNDGYVAFKIKTLPTLAVGSTFSNQANIYFDYNFPITTNNFTTTVEETMSNQSFEFANEFTLYPNPAKDVLHIQSKNGMEIQSVEIYNVLGQVVLAVPNATETINLSQLKSGNYFVKVLTEKGSSAVKFIKE